MECNRDESERCIAMAEKAFKVYDTKGARKLLTKAEKLFPSSKAQGLSFIQVIRWCNVAKFT